MMPVIMDIYGAKSFRPTCSIRDLNLMLLLNQVPDVIIVVVFFSPVGAGNYNAFCDRIQFLMTE